MTREIQDSDPREPREAAPRRKDTFTRRIDCAPSPRRDAAPDAQPAGDPPGRRAPGEGL